MSVSSDEIIEYQILMDAKQAITDLDALTADASSFGEKIDLIIAKIQEFADKTGMSIGTVLGLFKQLDAQMGQMEGFGAKGSSIFGPDPLTASAGWREVSTGVKEAESDVNSFTGAVNMARIALGTLEAMLLFNIVNAITTTFSNAISYANQYYQALYNISIAQDAMAKSGVNVSQQELLDIVTQIESKYKTLSETDIASAVSQGALITQQYHFNLEQLTQFSELAAALSQRSGQTMAETMDSLARAITGSNAKWSAELGVNLDQNAIKAEALKLGLAGVNDTLTEQQKAVAGLSLLYSELSPQFDKIQQATETIPGTMNEAKAQWTNAVTAMGQAITTALFPFVNGIILELQAFQSVIKDVIQPTVIQFFSIVQAGYMVIELALRGQIKDLADLENAWNRSLAAAQAYFQNLEQTGGTPQMNTPVSPTGGMPGADTTAQDLKNIESAVKDAGNAWNDYYNSVEKATADYNIKLSDMAAQFNLQQLHTVEDYNQQVRNEKANFREKEIEAERQYQLRIKELNDRYQFDLEDALRKRDALAVIKLMEQHQNEISQAKAQEQARIQQDQAQENLRLQQMKAAEQLKLKQQADEYNLEKQKAQEAYQNQLDDLQKSLQQKLDVIAGNLAQQLGLNENGANAIYDALKSYYGPNGKMDQLLDYSYRSMVTKSTQLLQYLQQIAQQYMQVVGTLGMAGASASLAVPSLAGVQGSAGGFSSQSFGGLSVPSMTTPSTPSLSPATSGGGSLKIEVAPSPYLITTVTQNTLDQAATIVNNSRRR